MKYFDLMRLLSQLEISTKKIARNKHIILCPSQLHGNKKFYLEITKNDTVEAILKCQGGCSKTEIYNGLKKMELEKL